MRYLIIFSALLLGACNVKVKSDLPANPPAKPVTCTRGLTREIPQAFQSVGTAVGAVKTESCETLVLGQNSQNEVVLAKYNAQGQPDETYGDRSVMKLIPARYANSGVRIQRLAVINNGFFALGVYGRGTEPRALFAFRFLDSGFLDLGYGPLRDGVARAIPDSKFDLSTVGAPVVENDLIRLRNRGEDLTAGTEVEREQLLLVSGSQAMEKDLKAVPVTCDLINHNAMKQQTTIQISQSGCAEMVFRTSGPAGSDALNLAMNGTVYFSNFTGEMRWYYEGRTPGANVPRHFGFHPPRLR
jgi:hypothetical protein